MAKNNTNNTNNNADFMNNLIFSVDGAASTWNGNVIIDYNSGIGFSRPGNTGNNGHGQHMNWGNGQGNNGNGNGNIGPSGVAGMTFINEGNLTLTGNIYGIEYIKFEGNDAVNFGTAMDFSGVEITINRQLLGNNGSYVIATGNINFGADQTFTVNGFFGLKIGDVVGNIGFVLVFENNTLKLKRPEPQSTHITLEDDIADIWDCKYGLREAMHNYGSDNSVVTFDERTNGKVVVVEGQIKAKYSQTFQGNGKDVTLVDPIAIANGHKQTFNGMTFQGSITGGFITEDRKSSAGKNANLNFNDFRMDGNIIGGSRIEGDVDKSFLGDVSITMKNFESSKKDDRIFGAGIVDGESILNVGKVSIDIDGDSTGNGSRIFLGGKISNGGRIVTGDISAKYAGGVWNNIFTGATTDTNESKFTCGDVTTVITGGTYTAFVSNGSQIQNGTATQGNSSMTITGGTFAGQVSAGGSSYGGESVVNGNTYLTITGGTFNGRVLAGSGANKSANGANTVITGSTYLVVDSSKNVIAFTGNLYSASMGAGVINGDTNMTFSGNGANLKFGATSNISGDSQAGMAGIRYVVGEQNLKFDAFEGDFGARINNSFTQVFVTDSQVILTADINTNYISKWNVEVNSAEAELTWGNNGSFNNFAGDTINLTLDENLEGSEWAVFAGGTNALRGWESAKNINICGTAAVYDATLNAWTTDEYKFYKNNGTLTLSKI